MTRDETAAIVYVDGDVGRLVAVGRALAHRGVAVATAVSAEHLARILPRLGAVRFAAVDPKNVDIVEVAALLSRTEARVGLVVLTDDAAQRARLARERGVVAVFSREGSADSIASVLRSALAIENVERVRLSTLLRLATTARSTFALRIDAHGSASTGVVWVEQGQIVHAEYGDQVGPNAVVAMLTQQERKIGLERETRAKSRTIHFDIDVFLSSFDVPDDEAELELVEEAAPPPTQSPRGRGTHISEGDGTYGLLTVVGAVDGVVSAALFDGVTGASVARIGLPLGDPTGTAGEASVWTSLTGAVPKDSPHVVEDAVLWAGDDAVVFVALEAPQRRVLAMHIDARATNVAFARLRARRLGETPPGLHDLVLTFGAADAELAEPAP